MIKPGDRVKARNVDFGGIVLGAHGRVAEGAGSTYWSTPSNMNLAISTVWNDSTGEVRMFALSDLDPVSTD